VAVVVGVRRYRAGAGVAGGCLFHLHSSWFLLTKARRSS